jgi:hypothetical protein
MGHKKLETADFHLKQNLKEIPLVFLERLVLLKGAVPFCQLDTLSINNYSVGAKPDLAIWLKRLELNRVTRRF